MIMDLIEAAVCKRRRYIGPRGREVALGNAAAVQRATERLDDKNIQENTTIRDGTLIGMVPARRFFEFQALNSNEQIEGRIGVEVEEPYRIAVIYTNTLVRASIRRVQVGRGQPKYTLLEILGPAQTPEPV